MNAVESIIPEIENCVELTEKIAIYPFDHLLTMQKAEAAPCVVSIGWPQTMVEANREVITVNLSKFLTMKRRDLKTFGTKEWNEWASAATARKFSRIRTLPDVLLCAQKKVQQVNEQTFDEILKSASA